MIVSLRARLPANDFTALAELAKARSTSSSKLLTEVLHPYLTKEKVATAEDEKPKLTNYAIDSKLYEEIDRVVAETGVPRERLLRIAIHEYVLQHANELTPQ